MAKKKSHVTPAAPCLYPFLKSPDTRWKKEGEYKVSLVFDQNDEFVAKIEDKAAKEFEKAKVNMKPAQAKNLKYVSPVKEDQDPETGEPTGNVKLSFKANAQFTKEEEVIKITMKVFDSKGKLIGNVPNIGNGSELKVSFVAVPTVVKGEFYLSLWMNAVQLIKLIEYNANGSSYGFGEEEGGFEVDEPSDVPFDSESGSGSGSTPEDDDEF